MSAHGPSLPRRPPAFVSVIRCLAAALGRWPARQLMTHLRNGRSKLAVMHNNSAEVNGLVYEWDVFEKRAGQWRLVSNVVLQVPK